jgi:hypothetical protein
MTSDAAVGPPIVVRHIFHPDAEQQFHHRRPDSNPKNQNLYTPLRLTFVNGHLIQNGADIKTQN